MGCILNCVICVSLLAQPSMTTLTPPVSIVEPMEVPDVASSFKAWMDYRTITDKASVQYEMQQEATTDDNGMRVYNDMYMIALGTYYATSCGEVFYITFDTDETIKCVVGDIKNDAHTDESNRYIEINGNVAEFIVDRKKISDKVKTTGDISNADDKFKGEIVKIEKINIDNT